MIKIKLLLVLDLLILVPPQLLNLRLPLPSLHFHLTLQPQDLLACLFQAHFAYHDLATVGSLQLIILRLLPLALHLILTPVAQMILLLLLHFHSRRFVQHRNHLDLQHHLLPCLRCHCYHLPFQCDSGLTLRLSLAPLQGLLQGHHST